MTGVLDETFLPYETERTVLRRLRPEDAPVLAAYRTDPDVARYQDWELPFTEAAAAELIANQAELTGPAPDRWIQIGIEHDGELAGDLAIGLDASGKLAMLGYTLRGDHQGRGLALEAASAAVDRLFGMTGVHRVSATLDPENTWSARLLERLGFRYEGRAVEAAPVRGAWLDDDRYALLASDRAAWLSRATHRPAHLRLVHVRPEHLAILTGLEVHHSQEQLIPLVRDALLEVFIPTGQRGTDLALRLRAVEADGDLVGIVVLQHIAAGSPNPRLRWLLIDRWHQRRGIGSAVVGLVAELVRSEGHPTLAARWPAGRAGPGRFFEAVGFVTVSSVDDGVLEGRLDLGEE